MLNKFILIIKEQQRFLSAQHLIDEKEAAALYTKDEQGIHFSNNFHTSDPSVLYVKLQPMPTEEEFQKARKRLGFTATSVVTQTQVQLVKQEALEQLQKNRKKAEVTSC